MIGYQLCTARGLVDHHHHLGHHYPLILKIQQVSALLEALFASLLKDENKDLRRKKERALRSKANKIQAQGEDEEDIIRVEEGEEEEVVKVSILFSMLKSTLGTILSFSLILKKVVYIIFSSKVNMEHSRISRGRKSLEKAVDLHKLPVIQVSFYPFGDMVLIDLDFF